MGGAVSSGRDNTELIDNLMGGNYIRSRDVERVFRALDRGDYMSPEARDSAYKDLAWRDGPLHMSAPCIYSEVMEGLELKPGLSFLNVGSGTGYLSTLVGLILGSSGINHGVEVHPYVVEYATKKLSQFMESSPTLDEFDFCEPKFICGNGLCLAPLAAPYDRVYCGAGCPEEYQNYFQQLIKVGGILIMPLNDNLLQVKRSGPTEWVARSLLNVSFATLRIPTKEESAELIRLEEQTPARLQQLARAVIRESMRGCMRRRHPHVREPPPRAPPAKRACPRRICIPVDDDSDNAEGLNALHDLDRSSGANEMNALLNLVLSMGHNRVAGALNVEPRLLDGSASSHDPDDDEDHDSISESDLDWSDLEVPESEEARRMFRRARSPPSPARRLQRGPPRPLRRLARRHSAHSDGNGKDAEHTNADDDEDSLDDLASDTEGNLENRDVTEHNADGKETKEATSDVIANDRDGYVVTKDNEGGKVNEATRDETALDNTSKKTLADVSTTLADVKDYIKSEDHKSISKQSTSQQKSNGEDVQRKSNAKNSKKSSLHDSQDLASTSARKSPRDRSPRSKKSRRRSNRSSRHTSAEKRDARAHSPAPGDMEWESAQEAGGAAPPAGPGQAAETGDVLKGLEEKRQKLDSGIGEDNTPPREDASSRSEDSDSRSGGSHSDEGCEERVKGRRRRQKRGHLSTRSSSSTDGEREFYRDDSGPHRARRLGAPRRDHDHARRRELAALMEQGIKELPLPLALQLYVNLGRRVEL